MVIISESDDTGGGVPWPLWRVHPEDSTLTAALSITQIEVDEAEGRKVARCTIIVTITLGIWL